uniref:Uncharacterized protein n=1 Tax=Candidatus Kentrum sp. LPFa TaxID=2126335 RepID=A0A450WL33_9GAMM|nr:MAG: hypothetical protein BECKLPF1236A_GA0070988_101782 [Candidatus Kentron sp. LPFa]VFK32603.1 MAG: hypothetical protein BECKLPF1236C_GA0070990_101732 [Candidatus Kentron sp. LPFa]
MLGGKTLFIPFYYGAMEHTSSEFPELENVRENIRIGYRALVARKDRDRLSPLRRPIRTPLGFRKRHATLDSKRHLPHDR